MTDDELDLIETPKLVDAIYRRCGVGAVLVVWVTDRTEALEEFQLAYRGGLTHAIGLAERAKVNLLEDCHRSLNQ